MIVIIIIVIAIIIIIEPFGLNVVVAIGCNAETISPHVGSRTTILTRNWLKPDTISAPSAPDYSSGHKFGGAAPDCDSETVGAVGSRYKSDTSPTQLRRKYNLSRNMFNKSRTSELATPSKRCSSATSYMRELY